MRKITLLLVAIVCSLTISAQKQTNLERANALLETQGELTFTFQVENNEDVEQYTRNLSLVNYDPATKTVKAWANEKQFRRFQDLNITFQVPMSENKVDESVIYDVRPLASRSSMSTLSFPVSSYPTYAEYAQQMQDFEDDYPALVDMFSIGSTGQGDKELLFVKISDNVATDEQEPKLMLTSSMHGDEIAGYPMMLSLINYILTVYADTNHADHLRVKNLVENTEIWINPSANPDGTYHNSATNTSVAQARRGNGNNIDLNRNYPDNVAGAHYDGEVYQTETLAFMALADANDFVISANFHGGTELVNYPFDNARTNEYTHADTDWYEYIGVEYATHCQTDANAGTSSTPAYNNKASYMTDDDDWDNPGGLYPNNYIQSPGVTHGAEWYRVYGGRQDYMNFYQHCREITIELSDTKILPESSLVSYWYYNRDALLDFLTQGTYGFRGLVKDANTTNVIEDVKVTVVGHDAYGSEVYTDNHGAYYRPIKGGTYSLTFEAPCYQTYTLNNQTITDYQTLSLSDILLTPLTATPPTGLAASGVGATNATIDWDATGTSYDLRYRVVGAPTWTEVTGLTTNTHPLTSLSISTQYEVQILGYCNANSSAYSSSVNFTTTAINYCTATSSDSSYEWVSRVQLNANDLDNSTGGTNYSDFTSNPSANETTTLTQNQNYTITLTPWWSGTVYAERYKVWIDFNRDGDFEDAGEEVLSQTTNNSVSNGVTVSQSFTVPSNITFGTTRMRVIMKDGNISGPCISYTYGEVEDYAIDLTYDGLMYSSSTWFPSAPNGTTGASNVLILDGNYNISTDVAVNDIEVGVNGSMTVSRTGSLTVNGNLTGNNNVTLESDSNEYSSLLVTGSVTGNVEYQRHANITGSTGGNDLIAPPVSGQVFTDFLTDNANIVSNAGNTLYLFGPFDKASGSYLLYANTESSTLDLGTGYRAASTDNGNFNFTGSVNTGNVNVGILNSGPSFQLWNLVGNPYPSYIKLADFLTDNTGQFDSEKIAVYGYDGDASNGWVIWNKAYSDANPNTLITPGQGFFVASKAGGGTVSFTPSMRSIGTGDDFISGRSSNNANNISHLKIKVENSSSLYNTDFYFTDNATLGLDLGYDAGVYGNSAPAFSIYSHLVQDNTGVDMAIQSVGNTDLDNNVIIPLGVNAAQGEQITISKVESTLAANVQVYLEDNVASTTTSLNSGDYVITPNTALSGTGRFYLRFESDTLSEEESELNGLQIFNTANPKVLHIKGLITEASTISVYDILGRDILTQDLSTNVNSQEVNISNLGIGTYIVEISNDFGTRTKKIIVME
ncbi:M14 family zinc carboxypeptidase [Pontimicrobium sp. IMCC45349]|uniref:M14 family zinc carboxypeptidase n=1 Tax=Pontimicrobium sp. IMCC45349 TaxID=3391574 RepID=UPI0039A2F145